MGSFANEHDHPGFESSVPFVPGEIRAAVVYCSDGRFGEQVDDFLRNGLGLSCYGRLVVPGGAACLVGHFAAHLEEEGVAGQLKFLVHGHGMQRVVLIAHEDCSYYLRRLKLPSFDLEEDQRNDLVRAAERVRTFAPDLQVDAFFAQIRDRTIRFEPVRV